MFYGVVRALFAVILRVFFDVRVEGVSNIPKEGPLLICANHISWWDPTLLAAISPRPISFMAKKELFGYPVFGPALRRLHAFPVDRGKGDIRSIRAALNILQNQGVLGIFPEGTRQRHTGSLGKMLPGAALLALKANAPVVPVAIRGDYRFRTKLIVKVGQPIRLQGGTGKTSTDLELGTKEIGDAIVSLWQSLGDREVA